MTGLRTIFCCHLASANDPCWRHADPLRELPGRQRELRLRAGHHRCAGAAAEGVCSRGGAPGDAPGATGGTDAPKIWVSGALGVASHVGALDVAISESIIPCHVGHFVGAPIFRVFLSSFFGFVARLDRFAFGMSVTHVKAFPAHPQTWSLGGWWGVLGNHFTLNGFYDSWWEDRGFRNLQNGQ